jgi:hypothetical protein
MRIVHPNRVAFVSEGSVDALTSSDEQQDSQNQSMTAVHCFLRSVRCLEIPFSWFLLPISTYYYKPSFAAEEKNP